MSEYTETPWNVSTWIEQPNNRTKPMVAARGVSIAITHPAPICREDECEANARHIVHCVNNMPKVVEALRNALACMESDLEQIEGEWGMGRTIERLERDGSLTDEIIEARTLLAQLEAEKGGEL